MENTKASISIEDIYHIVYQENPDPFRVLGIHLVTCQDENLQDKQVVAIRAFLPRAQNASVIALDTMQEYPMIQHHSLGFFEAICKDRQNIFSYQIKIVSEDGSSTQFYDSYSFMPGFSTFDEYLFNQGRHYKTYDKLGAHPVQMNGINGVYFAVWAPNAKSVSVIGSFNYWDRRYHTMRVLGSSGVWEIFIPGIGDGVHYKYQIITKNGSVLDKSDPYGFGYEISPNTASVVYDINTYEWQDEVWMKKRHTTQAHDKPMSIYEVHLGSWFRNEKNDPLNYREIVHRLASYVKEMGYTHIEILPIMEHPFYGSWGYQCLGLFAPTSRYGIPLDFMFFMDVMHQNDIGVILDWVPAHFPKDPHGLANFDGTHLYEHADPRQRDHRDWNTYVYNYGRNEVRAFLINSALFWLDKYHADGLRVDAVASMLYLDYSRKEGEWVPNKYGGRENLEALDFIKECNSVTQEMFPGTLMIAEESTAWPKVSSPLYLDGLGYSHKWNMGWMHDFLEYMSHDPIYRKYKHDKVTFSIWYAFSEKFILPISHDEVVYGKGSVITKMPGDIWQKFANMRLLYMYMFSHPGKKLLFMGCDFGQWNEWWHETAIDWHLLEDESHRKLHAFVKTLNGLYREHPACHERDFSNDGFEWINFQDSDNSVVAFLRKSSTESLLFVFNFTPVPRHNYKLGVYIPGAYKEILNSDSKEFDGSNIGNLGLAHTHEEGWQGRPYTLSVQIPPLGGLCFEVPKST